MVFKTFLNFQPPDCLRSDGEVGVSTKRALAFRCRTLDRLLSRCYTLELAVSNSLEPPFAQGFFSKVFPVSKSCLASSEVAPDFQLEI